MNELLVISITALFLAACLHDVVYDARAGDNEERSVAYAEHRLGTLGVPPSTIQTALVPSGLTTSM